jgi:hypothetical protein
MTAMTLRRSAEWWAEASDEGVFMPMPPCEKVHLN